MFWGLIFTILIGLFFLIGIIIDRNIKEKEHIQIFSIALAFVTMMGLLIFDLLKEIIETKNLLLIIPIIFGFFLITILDKLIPHHNHHHENIHDNKKEHNLHFNHIGIITIIALAIHNLLEGLTLYGVTLSSVKSGLLMMISISLHNIPLGFQIGNSLNNEKNNNNLIFFLCISAFLGALIYICFGSLNILVEQIFLSITFGMLLYILLFELLRELITYIKKKEAIYGIMIGIVVLIITLLV